MTSTLAQVATLVAAICPTAFIVTPRSAARFAFKSPITK
jgi:hypothetical protein